MNVYYYLFYKLYQLAERTTMPWWSDFKASLVIACVEMAILALAEYKIALFTSTQGVATFGKWGYILIIGGPPLFLNYMLFLYKNRWKEIVCHFEKAERQERSKMNLQITILITIVIGAFVFLLLL